MSLSMVMEGETRIIRGVKGQEEMKRHLQDLGFIRGEKVRVVGENAGGMILMVKGVKVALNRGLAHRIMVEDQEVER
ncbi:MAG: ferrous iron transport protein A [Hungatella sp.]|nr:ferrous iron transport protein A [Hungatella sp.]